MKHTPGPWKVVRPDYSPHRIYVRGGVSGQWPNGIRDITWFQEHKSGTHRGEEARWTGFDPEDEWNARLIAATPDLLEGSLELLEMLKEGYGWNEQNCGCDVDGQGNHAPLCPVIKLQSAIRKARGEQL